MTEEKKLQELSQAEREAKALADRSQARLKAVLAKAQAKGEIVQPTPLTVARAELFEARLVDNRKKRRATNTATSAVVNAVSGALTGPSPAGLTKLERPEVVATKHLTSDDVKCVQDAPPSSQAVEVIDDRPRVPADALIFDLYPRDAPNEHE